MSLAILGCPVSLRAALATESIQNISKLKYLDIKLISERKGVLLSSLVETFVSYDLIL